MALTRRVATDFLATCERIETGRLRVRTPEGYLHDFGSAGTEAEFQINDWSAGTALLNRGDVGFGEGYVAGLWDTPAIEPLVELALLNEESVRRYAFPSRWNGLAFRVLDRIVRRNSIAGFSRNIRAHYDVGNEFYGEWLDPGFTYSSALFDDGDKDLARGHERKYDRILDRIGDRERILEIGCGSPRAPRRCSDAPSRASSGDPCRRSPPRSCDRPPPAPARSPASAAPPAPTSPSPTPPAAPPPSSPAA